MACRSRLQYRDKERTACCRAIDISALSLDGSRSAALASAQLDASHSVKQCLDETSAESYATRAQVGNRQHEQNFFLQLHRQAERYLPPEVRRHAESPRRRQRPSARLTGKRVFGVLIPARMGGGASRTSSTGGVAGAEMRSGIATRHLKQHERSDRAHLTALFYNLHLIVAGTRVRPPCARLDLKPFADGSAVGFCPERLPIRPARDPGPLAPQKMRQPPTVLLELGL